MSSDHAHPATSSTQQDDAAPVSPTPSSPTIAVTLPTPTSPTSPASPPLPPSILRSTSFQQSNTPSKPGTPDTNSIHFSSGAHPEHHVVNPQQHIHPASRPSSTRRISTDTIPGYVESAATTSSEQVPLSGSSSTGNSTPHGILKRTGQPNYGGLLGKGPSLPPKSRTASSGGLSADIKPGYERRVGFDSMVDADETASGAFGFTLQVKSHGYRRTRNTRTYMCAVDSNSFSERALEWLMESLVEDNDEIVAVRVLDGDPDTIDQEEAREQAKELMSAILVLNEDDRKISIVVEFIAGRVTSTIIRLIHMYRPDSLTIGTRGRSVNAFQKLIGGSMIGGNSRDILSRSPVPVVVVRPEAKVAKHLRQRQADPKRRSYHHLVAKADDLPLSIPRVKGSASSHPSNSSSSGSLSSFLHHHNNHGE